MNYEFRLWQDEKMVIKDLKEWSTDGVVLGIGAWKDICMCGLVLMMRYGWTQQDLQQAWPKLFKERKL